jgi:hypothetical protein
MAADLTLLRSRLLVPADAIEAQDAAEQLRRRLLHRAEITRAADWLEVRGQLGGDVLTRGHADADGTLRAGRAGDITALLRACLVVIRVPGPPFWSVADAADRIREMLSLVGQGGAPLVRFLPEVPADAADCAPLCRGAVAGTFLARLD